MIHSLVYLAIILLHIGWTNEVQDGKLSIYQVKVSKDGPAEVIFSLTIKDSFSWHLFFRRQLLHPACCSILMSIPSELNSGMYLIA